MKKEETFLTPAVHMAPIRDKAAARILLQEELHARLTSLLHGRYASSISPKPLYQT